MMDTPRQAIKRLQTNYQPDEPILTLVWAKSDGDDARQRYYGPDEAPLSDAEWLQICKTLGAARAFWPDQIAAVEQCVRDIIGKR